MLLHKKLKDNRGSFTIEAILSLSVFMFAFIMIASLALVAKVEGMTQYAIDQTSKEISKYCYIPSRIGLIPKQTYEDAKIDQVDDTVGAIMDFSDSIQNSSVVTIGTQSTDLDKKLTDIEGIKDDYESISTSAKALYSSASSLMSDPKGTIVALAKLTTTKASSAIVSRLIAQPVCETLFKKYVTSNNVNADETLKKLGVEDGLNGLNFGMSTFLMDGRSINVVLVYKIKVKGFGLGDRTINVKQTASTAAWIYNGGTIPDEKTQSTWDMNDLDRGKKFVSIVQQEQNLNAVDAGCGVDLYDPKTNTYTSVNSMQVFDKTYSQFNDKAEKNDQYTANLDKIKSNMRTCAQKLSGNVDGLNSLKVNKQEIKVPSKDEKKRKCSVYMIIPKDTVNYSGLNSEINKAAEAIEKETGVKINLSYRN